MYHSHTFMMEDDHQERQRLLGKNVHVPIPSSPDGHLVTNLPLLNNNDLNGMKHWAGLLPASGNGDKYLFYWLFEPDPKKAAEAMKKNGDDDETSIPLIIWLNGGPACSSMDGLWLENGPFRLTQDTNNNDQWMIQIDPYSWHTAPAYVLYIDQPVGTGISFTTSDKYPDNDEKVNIDFYYFLKKFMKFHQDKFLTKKKNGSSSQWTLNRPFYFSGESHAGHYIPSMMNYIRKQNEGGKTDIVMPLSGAAIGNGWIDPMYQYSAQDAAYGHGLIGKAQQRALALREEKCRDHLRKGKYLNDVCKGLREEVFENSQGRGSQYVVSPYDQRKWEVRGEPRNFPPGHKDVEAYLGGHNNGIPNAHYKDVLEAIHSTPSLLSGQRYYECTGPPKLALMHQHGKGVVPDVVDLLNANVRMLFFNGIHDLICNHVGNENAVENFPWQSQSEYQLSERYGWMAPSIGLLGGYMKEYENLMYLKVLDSGHMVPLDVPDVALDMIRTFIYYGSFQSYLQDIKAEPNTNQSSSCPTCPTCDTDDDDYNMKYKIMNYNSAYNDDLQISGTEWVVLAFLSLIGCTFGCWLFLVRGRNGGGSTSRRLPTHSLSPTQRRRQTVDMELPLTTTSILSNGNHDGLYRDDNGYSD